MLPWIRNSIFLGASSLVTLFCLGSEFGWFTQLPEGENAALAAQNQFKVNLADGTQSINAIALPKNSVDLPTIFQPLLEQNSGIVHATWERFPDGAYWVGICFKDELRLKSSTIESRGGLDFILLRFNENGRKITWVHHYGSEADEFLADIALNMRGEVFFTGYFKGEINFKTTGDSLYFQSAGDKDLFLSALSSTGNSLWTLVLGDEGEEQGTRIACRDQKLMLEGKYTRLLDLDPSSNVATVSSSSAHPQFFQAWYTENGIYTELPKADIF